MDLVPVLTTLLMEVLPKIFKISKTITNKAKIQI